MKKEDFISKYKDTNLKCFTDCKYIIMAMLGLKSDGSISEQKKSIEAFLGRPLS